MSEPDEYDAYFVPLNLNDEDLDAIDAAESRARPHSNSTTQDDLSHTPPSPDEFDAYDLSEFSAADLAEIDELVDRLHGHSPLPPIREVHDEHERPSASGSGSPRDRSSPRRGGGDVPNGGPAIEIALESAGKADPSRRLKDSWIKHTKRSPYEQFRKWNRLLTVTDIAGPSWCEVQFDYGLRQRRNRKLSDRPASFTTAEGKTITVAHQVAVANNLTVTRGRSVHKVLEREIQQEPVQIEIKTNEERWALRIVNMLTAVQTLMGLGKCREMPVFGFVHGQIVTGIIDEVVRLPLPASPPREEQEQKMGSTSPNKRPAPRTAPSTPAKPSSKKQHKEPTSDQPQITAYFSPTKSQGSTAETAIDVDMEEPTTPAHSQAPLHGAPGSTPPSQLPRYSLHLSDTKTRIRPTLPPEEDTFASHIQLMLYNRLLSGLLATARPDNPSSQPFDFDALWRQVEVDPTRRFSDSFLIQAGLSESQTETQDSTSTESIIDSSEIHCLNDLTRAWRHAVEALNVAGVDKTLTIVYRAQPRTKGRPSANGKKAHETNRDSSESAPSPLSSSALSVSEQEAQDLAAAIQASISDVQPGLGGDDELARAIYESLEDAIRSGRVAEGELGVLTNPFGPPISETSPTLEGASRMGGAAGVEGLSDEFQLAWALQESLLAKLEETPVLKEAISHSAASGVDAPVASEKEAEEEDPSGVALGKLVQRAATEELEGAAESAPSVTGVEEDEDEVMITAADLETEAWIIGTKEFEVDDALLDDYLERVLAWWYGERPPQGVDVGLTRRCVTCEYRDGCEWREKKANEALQKFRDRSGTPLTGPSAPRW
ncbi:exonuclease V a 5' deoxyribonuclease-domain-containing protein [Dichomitus squalens]|nr:exonuclease V a 5' deoxyribonuclease-domain-containing protein [Dichomitus squalens]